MNTSISDPVNLVLLEEQLKAGGITKLNIGPITDFPFNKGKFAVYFATLCKEMIVFDAWLIMGGGDSGYYNHDNYPTIDDAMAQHIGRLVMAGKVNVLEQQDEKRQVRRRRSKSS